MKLTALLFFMMLMQVSAKGYSQSITLNFENVSLEKVIKEIKRESGYYFLYNNAEITKARKISVHINNNSIEEAMKAILKSTQFGFQIVDKTIVLSPIVSSASTQPEVNRVALADIKGRVTDENGSPLSGVSVKNKEQKKVTFTDKDGEYSIFASLGETLIFSYVGYNAKSVKINSTTLPLNVTLQPLVGDLNQVVVIGYGSTQRKDLTGSVSTINVAEIKDVPFLTVDNALAGKAAGVQVTKSDGTPGGAVRIRIRGSSSLLGGNDPLYVIDGIPLQVTSTFQSPGFDISSPVGNDVTSTGGSSTALSTAFVNGLNSVGGLNPDDIESITILKDAASTAIYGSKAANGVVIITTKRGKKNMKPLFTANYYATSTTPITPKLLNLSQYKTLLTEAAQGDVDAITPTGDDVPDIVNAILNKPGTFFGNANTNWIKEVTRTTLSHSAEISMQGGSDVSKYFSSIGYNNTPGVIKNTGFKRVTGHLNMDNDLGSKITFATNLLVGYTDQAIGAGAYEQALRARPDSAPYDENGDYTNFNSMGPYYLGFQNPVALLTATNNAKTLSLLGSISGIYKIAPNLVFKSIASLNSTNYNQRNYAPSYIETYTTGGVGSNSNSRSTNWLLENTLSYDKRINENNTIDFLAGTSYETNKTSFFSATGTGYPNDNVLNSLTSAVSPRTIRGDDPGKPQSYLLSFYLRANYAFKDKYLVTFTGRADGSSKFGPANKYGYFPSAAFAWRVSQENFLKKIKWIDDIKFRVSYGLTGNQNIGDQMYRTLYSPDSYAGASALVPVQLGNEAIKWETAKQFDAGLDVSLFNRLQLTVDYYNKQSDDILLSLPIGGSSGYSNLLRNAIGIKNTGLELALQGDIIRTTNFRWNASLNVTWAKSIVTNIDPAANLSQIGNLTGLEYNNTTLVNGQPLGLITGRKVTGIIKTQAQLDAYKAALGEAASDYLPYLGIGDPMYQLMDISETSRFPDNTVIIGSAAPKYYGGFNQSVTYKDLSLQFYFTFSQGGKLLWGDHISSVEFSGVGNASVAMLNRYTPQNTDTNLPRLLLTASSYTRSDLDLFNSSYLKLRTITLNYNLSKLGWVKKANIRNTSLYMSATNLFTITHYPGSDPETSNDSYSAIGGYFDSSNYPTVRTVSIGFKAGF